MQLTTLPNPNEATLPSNYEAARNALTECSKLDECKDWADKAMALASYARQADDESLKKLSLRIQARAIRRCGELLKEVEPSKGGNPSLFLANNDGNVSLTRKAVAEAGGLSQGQKDRAIQVANVPEHEFEAMVESENPPTVTELAEKGKQRRTVLDLGGATHEQFVASSQIIGMLNSSHLLLNQHKPEEVAAGMNKAEKKKIKQTIEEIGEWINNFYQLL